MEGIGEAGEEVERNKVGDDEGEKNREDRELPEREGFRGGFGRAETEEFEIFARNESEGEREENKSNTDKAKLKEEANSLVLDDGVGDGVNVLREGSGHSNTGAAEADAEENIIRRGEPSTEGDGIESEAGVSRGGDVAVKLRRLGGS